MVEKPTVAFRVDADTKAAWSEAVEQSDEYASLSHLIKKAVNRELHGGGATTGGETGASSQQMGELIDTVENLRGQIDGLEGAVTDATRSMNAGGGVSEDTTTKVFTALPRGPERATTAEGIAEGLNVDSDTVRVALEQLHETTAAVRKQEIQQLEEGDGTTTITTKDGRELEIEDSGTAIRRRNPLWYRRD